MKGKGLKNGLVLVLVMTDLEWCQIKCTVSRINDTVSTIYGIAYSKNNKQKKVLLVLKFTLHLPHQARHHGNGTKNAQWGKLTGVTGFIVCFPGLTLKPPSWCKHPLQTIGWRPSLSCKLTCIWNMDFQNRLQEHSDFKWQSDGLNWHQDLQLECD